MHLKPIITAAALAAVALGTLAVAPAEAQGGCGPYRHRGWDGWCHPGGWGGPRPFYGYGYGWHRPWGWHRHWGWHRPGWGPGWRGW